MNTVGIGFKGEDLAVNYLRNLGYKILDRNFRIKGGEIDIIAWDGDWLVFVEVKTRSSHDYGLPIESITPWKIKFLLKSALFYITKKKLDKNQYRLDFLGIDYADNKEDPKIELIKNITW